jgi:hypothetical protein
MEVLAERSSIVYWPRDPKTTFMLCTVWQATVLL